MAYDLENIRKRYEGGERLPRLAREVGLSWQKLHAMLFPSGTATPGRSKSRRQPKPTPPTPTGGGSLEPTPDNPAVLESDGVHRIGFESMSEAMREAFRDFAQNEHNRLRVNQAQEVNLDGTSGWVNGHTKDSLLGLLADPPEELTDAVARLAAELVDQVAPPSCARRRVRRNQEFGQELNPEQVLTRSLTPWERHVRETTPRHSVTVGVNVAVLGHRERGELLWRGAAAAALADILTRQGLNVEIVAFWCSSEIGTEVDRMCARYQVKRADMPLDLGATAVMLSDIAFARIVVLYGKSRHVPGQLSAGLGRSCAVPERDRRDIDYLADYDILHRQAATRWLTDCVHQHESEVTRV